MNQIKISFLGDISLNDNYIQYYKGGINPFSTLESTLSASDFVVGNLECLVKGDQGENELKKPRLTTTLETLNYLKNIHLNIACLAQNHIYDHLEDGFIKTTDKLNEINIQHLGAGHNYNEAEKPIILVKNNIRIALFNSVALDTNPNLPIDAAIKLNIFDINKCKKEIATIKNSVNHVVITLHWGGRVEGGLYPDWHQKKIAHELIDSGADLIIGHHTHTVQPYESYKGKFIFYSLGNFCFSDFWFEKKFYPLDKRKRITYIPLINFHDTCYTVSHQYYFNNNNSFNHLENYHLTHKIQNLIYGKILSKYPFWMIYFFTLKKIAPIYLFLKRTDIDYMEKVKRIGLSLNRRLS